ncbi:hypothetical protein OIO90_001914 [Microbotryomycetes sp. JL221]|nr:hypothetical protein OIO90_001914 [Microbotryomycetes sp. JL221]
MPPKLTQPLRPVARYRKGKGVQTTADTDSDSEDDNNAQHQVEQQQDELDEAEQIQSFSTATTRQAGSALKSVTGGTMNISLNNRQASTAAVQEQSSEYETDSEDEAPPKPVFNKQATVTAQAKSAPAEESSEYETGSEEEEEEEEEEPKVMFKPVFVSKRNRDTVQQTQKDNDPDQIEQQRQVEIEERKKQSQNLIAESIMRELAEKEAVETFPDVDDTDGLDPEAEFEAWKLRELKRIKRDKEARYAREKEREEVEARRALPEGLRMKEDLEHAKKTREEKKKGSQAFLQKYHHKGAFYSDLDILKKHDYTAPTESTNVSMDALPKAMQNKNFGKRSQTKYTHLANEDTSDKQAGWGNKRGFGGGNLVCFHCGGPHMKKDCPQLAGAEGSASFGPESGHRDNGYGNRAPPEERRRNDRNDRDHYRSRDYDRDRDYDRRRDDDGRRSRSPPASHRRSGVGHDDRYKDRERDDRRPRDQERRLEDDDRRRSEDRRVRLADAEDGRDDKRRRL